MVSSAGSASTRVAPVPWDADHGCTDFYTNVWRDEAVAAELEKRLHALGGWGVLKALADNG